MKTICVLTLVSIAILFADGHEQKSNNEVKDVDDDRLLLVQVLFRHGDRTPAVLYKNDHYDESQFVEGLGQLTANGKARIYRYGKLLRQRYKNYVENLSVRNVRAQSSPSRRCVESSQLLLAGLFPPKQSWSSSDDDELARLWQPIAVESVEKSRAWLLNSEADCPAATQIENTISEQYPVRQFLSQHYDWIKKLEIYTGQNYSSWYDVGYLWDTLLTEQEYFGDKFVRPKWLDIVGNDTWKRLYRFNQMEIGCFDISPKYQRLRGGPFLKEIIFNMATTLGESVDQMNRQLFTYGSHDTMISYIIQALGFWKSIKESPNYGSGLIIELWKDDQHIPQVSLFYANSTNNFDIYQLHFNESRTFSSQCSMSHCTFDSFKTSLKRFIPTDLESECTLSY